MARTKPSLPARSSSPPGSKPPPREDSRGEGRLANTSGGRSNKPKQKGALMSLSRDQAPAVGTSDVAQGSSLKKPSASASRGGEKPRAQKSRHRPNGYHRGGGRNSRYASRADHRPRDGRYSSYSGQDSRYESNRRDELRGQDYHRRYDGGSWNNERPGSSWGRDRDEPPLRDHSHNPPDNSRHSDQKRPKYGHPHGNDNFHDSRRRPEYDSAPSPNEDQLGRQTTKTTLDPSARSQRELSSNEKLKEELEREALETKIARARLERQKIQLELSRMKNSAASITIRSTDSDSDDEVLRTRNSSNKRAAKRRITQPSTDDDSDAEFLLPENSSNKKGAKRRIDDDSDDEVQAKAKSSNDGGPKQASRTPNASQTNKTSQRRRRRERAKLKRQIRVAQKTDDEKMKFKLLKAYEEDLVTAKAKKLHCYTEKDLMSNFAPVILDHDLMAGDGKFLVKWVPKSTSRERSSNDNENHCISWISHEDFLFPVRARKYLSRKIMGNTCNDEIEGLKVWVEDCEERERCLNCLSTFDTADEDYESHMEIDFCCFLCKCPWDHPLKHTIRNCESGLKYHRGCCHDYNNLDDFSSFVSPVGKVVEQQYGGDEDDEEEEDVNGENENNAPDNPVAPNNENAGILQDPNPMTIIDGQCERYLQCVQNRSTMMRTKRDAVVVCINAGIGSVAMSLKNLGIKVATIIHGEADRVAQHVIRSNHDHRYGEIDCDDGIDHIVGLYESLADLKENPEKMVRKYGPIDMIICNSPQRTTRGANQDAIDFFDLVKSIETLNVDIHHFDRLFYLLESSPCIKDHLPCQDISYCICEPEKMYLCNWPISSQKVRLLGSGTEEDAMGLPQGYVQQSVKKLYACILESLCAGPFNFKWREKMHPKLWAFMSMGPTGYDVKLNKGVFGPEAFSLRLTNPTNLRALSGVDYSNYLLGQSSSVRSLDMLLNSITVLFNQKDYGPRYKTSAPQQEQKMSKSAGGIATQEHGGIPLPTNSSTTSVASNVASESAGDTTTQEHGRVSPQLNSSANDLEFNAAAPAPAIKTEENDGIATQEHGGIPLPTNLSNNSVASSVASESAGGTVTQEQVKVFPQPNSSANDVELNAAAVPAMKTEENEGIATQEHGGIPLPTNSSNSSVASESAGGTTTQEHGRVSPQPNSSVNDLEFNAAGAPAIKTEGNEGIATQEHGGIPLPTNSSNSSVASESAGGTATQEHSRVSPQPNSSVNDVELNVAIAPVIKTEGNEGIATQEHGGVPLPTNSSNNRDSSSVASESAGGTTTQEHVKVSPQPNSSANDVELNAAIAPVIKTEENEGIATQEHGGIPLPTNSSNSSVASESAGGTTTQEHGRSAVAPVIKTEIKEEQDTDEEADVYTQVESTFTG